MRKFWVKVRRLWLLLTNNQYILITNSKDKLQVDYANLSYQSLKEWTKNAAMAAKQAEAAATHNACERAVEEVYEIINKKP